MGLKGISAAEQLSQLAEGLQKNFARSAMPSGLASMMEVSRSFERIASPFAGLNIGGVGKLAVGMTLPEKFGGDRFASGARLGFDLHERFAGTTKLVDAAGQFGQIQRSIAGLPFGGNDAWRSITKIAESFGSGLAADLQLARIARFDRSLAHVLAEPAALGWSRHLQMTALGTVGLLGREWPAAVGFVTQVDPDRGGVFSWLARHQERTLIMTAAIALDEAIEAGHAEEETSPVSLEAEYVCAVCEAPMMTLGRNVRWIGPLRGVVRRRIFPLCIQCWEEEQRDPGFLYRALCDLTRPAIGVVREVIRGGGEGDGRPRALLHLVPKKS